MFSEYETGLLGGVDAVLGRVRELRPLYGRVGTYLSTSIVNDAGDGAVPTPFVTDIVYCVGGVTGRSLVVVVWEIRPLVVSSVRNDGRAGSMLQVCGALPSCTRVGRNERPL